MVQVQDKLTVQRSQVTQLLNQLTVDYQNTKSERKQIAEYYPGSDQAFSLLEELELLTVDICGYAAHVQTARPQDWQQTIAQLQTLRVFDRPVIAQFYAENSSHYPQIQAYIRTLDYLRLLVLEYGQMQQDNLLTSA
jgi:hypothetical protein